MIAVIAMLFTYRGVSLNFDSSNEPADAFHDITLTHMILCLFANVIIFAALDYYLILVTSGISEVAVSIQNLTKTFARDDGGTFRAVDNLRVDFYKNQITSFLGHNGAGKSTTCALLTGELSPDSGDAFIHGHSIVSEMEKIRTLIGVCPQKNVIWDLLSPREHLQLKLCTAIALVGDPSVVFLDEPTSGMDSNARRHMWDILFKYKGKDKAIVLCTHQMDEADILGDRVAILSAGQLQESGTPEYLKAKFGKGGSNRMQLLQEISTAGAFERDMILQSALDALEKQRSLGLVEGFGITATNLEDVFWNLGEEAEVAKNGEKKQATQLPENLVFEKPGPLPKIYSMLQPFGVAWNGMDLPHDDVINKMSAWSAADSSLPIPVNATHVTPLRTSSPNNDNRGDLGLAGAFEFDMHTHPRYEYSILTNQSVTLSLFGLISYANNAIWAAESDSSTRPAFLTAIIGGLIFCMGISMMTGKLSMEVVEYALSYMIWDIMQALVMLAPLYIFCVSTGNSISLGATILALFLYFFAMVPIVHMISRAFEDSANSYMVIYYSLLVSFVGLYVCAQIWAGIIFEKQGKRGVISYVGTIAPSLCPIRMNTTIRTARTPLGYLLYEGIFFFALYLLVEHFSEHPIFGKLDFIWFQVKQYIYGDNIDIEQFSSSEIEDDDVRAEREAVTTSPIFDDGSIVMRDLRKQYHPTGMQQFEGTTAVRDLSLHILPKECFSLLGSNGAGKTSVMNMILRQARASSGNILIDGYNSRALPRSVITSMSYCPQHNCLFDTLTAKECLIFYCKIRGVPENLMEKYVTEWMTTADLLQHENTWCRNLSGGNKRKLSLAIALIGSPKIVILDEPTAGVDPTARRKLHWLINATKRRGATIVLTTHHIDEAASLGERVGIMVKGYMCCLGTTQHLLHHYGEGYMLNAFMVAGCSIDEILLPKVKEICPSLHLGDSKDFNIASLYRAMKQLQAENKVEYFTCGQARLEDVFLKLTNRFVKKRSDTEE
eukprot:GSChrysophyteH1.ASY1.ANO1.1119.1 assembled CDS